MRMNFYQQLWGSLQSSVALITFVGTIAVKGSAGKTADTEMIQNSGGQRCTKKKGIQIYPNGTSTSSNLFQNDSKIQSKLFFKKQYA